MASMRVHELAKEFGIPSKELLERLEEMKIPAKGHSSTLVDAYVSKIRKQLGPEVAERAAAAEQEKRAEQAKKAAAERARREEEAAAHKAAVEKERAQRKAERAQRDGDDDTSTDATASDSTAKSSDDARSGAATGQTGKGVLDTKAEPAPKKIPRFSGLLSQIEAEANRIEAEKAAKAAEKKAKAEAKAAGSGGAGAGKGGAGAAGAAGAGATGAGAGSLGAGASTAAGKAGATGSTGVDAKSADTPSLSANKAAAGKSGHEQGVGGIDGSGVLRTIKNAAQDSTVEDDGEAKGARKGKGRKGKEGAGRDGSGDGDGGRDGGRGRKGKEARKAPASVRITQVDDDSSEDDRYRRMALAAEQLQRERVLADARAAVAAAGDDGGGRRKKRKEKRVAEAKERAELDALEKGLDPELVLDTSVAQITTGATVQEFADALGVTAGDVVKRLFLLGSPLTATQTMSDDLIDLIAGDLERKIRIVSPEEEYSVQVHDTEAELRPRPPVVTVMGHVDHGKTSLLDAIRETGVVATEAGGITQHIGASVVHTGDKLITFIDTPGHEAFTAMRARGAKVTDVAVLVVAADDGVMPQTVESINHAAAADVPIVVAVNKVDKDGATPERVRQELTEHGIIPEEWGGQNMFVDVSAKKRTGIDDVLEAIILQADVLELRANPDALASGFVIEANLDKGRGPVATVLVQRGTLRVGDSVVAGTAYGRVRALVNPLGENVSDALPAAPVEILGLGSVPGAGDEFRVFADERDARNLAEERALRQRLAEHQKSHVTLEDLFTRIEQDKLSELNLVVKADVQGSIEALKDALDKMDQSEVRINVIHSAVGGITETDITLAAASDAIVIGFGVRPTAKAKQMAEKEKVEIKTYKVIYQAIEEINAARVGLLAPEIVEQDTGMAEVRDLFKVPKVGTVAGCLVVEGEIGRNDRIRLVRNGTIVHEGTIVSLRRFKEDVTGVKAGYECGIGIEGYQDIKTGDVLETYRVTEVAREG